MAGRYAALIAGIMLGLGGGAALAAGSGGGGAGDMPSVSGPTYDPTAEYARGVAALNAQKYKDAERAFQRVVRVAPRNAEAWRLLGAANVAQNDFKAARRAYERAVGLEPDNIQGRQGLGVSLGALKDAKAQEQLAWLKARAEACGSCVEAGSLKDAVAAVENAMTVAPAAARVRPMIFADAQAGDRAMADLAQALRDGNPDSQARLARAVRDSRALEARLRRRETESLFDFKRLKAAT